MRSNKNACSSISREGDIFHLEQLKGASPLFLIKTQQLSLMNEPNIDRHRELAGIAAKLPPLTLLELCTEWRHTEIFMHGRAIWGAVEARLVAYFTGEEPPKLRADWEATIRAETCYALAQYKLIFESWNYLKPLAIARRLIEAGDKPKDYMFKMLAEIQTYQLKREILKPIPVRTAYDRTTKALSTNKKIVIGEIFDETEWKRLKRNRQRREENTPLIALLLEVSTQVSATDPIVRAAQTDFQNALIVRLQSDSELLHWRRTSKTIK